MNMLLLLLLLLGSVCLGTDNHELEILNTTKYYYNILTYFLRIVIKLAMLFKQS